ncbi:MAG: metal-sulfur cluster assembly factor [Patescibacteria group bacterium]
MEELKEKILEALKKVEDPELRINVVDLGLIYGLGIKSGKVKIAMTATTPFCPYLPQLIKDVEKNAGKVSGVKEVSVEVVWAPPWSPSKLSQEAKAQLGIL